MSATLGGDQENPPTTHAGTGTATVSNYNLATRTFDISVTVTDLPPGDVIGFHIHQERVGVNGPIIVDFPSGGDPALVPSGTGFTFTATGLVLPEAQRGGLPRRRHLRQRPYGGVPGRRDSRPAVLRGNATVTTQTGDRRGEHQRFEIGDRRQRQRQPRGQLRRQHLERRRRCDWMLGGPGNDTLNGGAGNDVLIWSNGDGTDFMEGGADSDTVQVNGSIAAATRSRSRTARGSASTAPTSACSVSTSARPKR